ncbi:hypothetical protein [Lentibacillus juripiscarius]|uniref:Lipoprotein n=1 Tax=Lentibacillus juripiscarius TaxID=257446 RepID=A0ABW5V8S3_9BACI
MRRIYVVMIVLFGILVLTGCSMIQSEEEAIQHAGEAAEKQFHADDAAEANQELDILSMYVPAGLEVDKEEASNIILKDGSQTYIVFYNELEGPKSKLSYKAAAAKEDEALLLETFEDKDKFGYIRIMPADEEDKYELQLGVGGVKITTYTPKSSMEDDAEAMMKMSRSIAFENRESASE